MRPLIGVTTKSGEPEWVGRHSQKYLDALSEFGADSIVLSPDKPAIFPKGQTFAPDEQGRLARNVLDQLDGLILAGGGDVDPKYFGAAMNGANPKTISLLRDELELRLSYDALENDLPTFGICRGCQVLNVAAGGGMVQHFDGHRSKRENPSYHDIQIAPNSRLHAIVGTDMLPANTYHHQGIDHATLASIFTPTGICTTDDWLIEAYESNSHRWMVAVQWHPERLNELSDEHRKLWSDFVAACRQYRSDRLSLSTVEGVW